MLAKLPDLGRSSIGVENKPAVGDVDLAQDNRSNRGIPPMCHRRDGWQAKRMRSVTRCPSQVLPSILEEKLEIV